MRRWLKAIRNWLDEGRAFREAEDRFWEMIDERKKARDQSALNPLDHEQTK